jgi:hypothetical protein
MLAPAVEAANKALVGREAEPLPDGLTPHWLRRTFASLLYALGETPMNTGRADDGARRDRTVDLLLAKQRRSVRNLAMTGPF